MPAFNRFNAWTDTMVEAANCGTDQFAIALTNSAPSASNTVLADITQIAYTGFGSRNLTTTSSTQTGGVYSLVWASLTLGTTVTSATFRYVVIYDDTLAGDPLVGWYDLGVGTTIPANTSLILSGMGLDLDGSFDPLSLFSGGEQGAWYDPSDLSTLWQDSARTTPVTADGQPVGCIDDKSGNGNHLKQATAGARPLYKTDGVLHWLLFDGSASFMETSASVDLSGTDKLTAWVGVVQSTVTNCQVYEFGTTSISNGSASLYIQSSLRPTLTVRGSVSASFMTGSQRTHTVPFFHTSIVDFAQSSRDSESSQRINWNVDSVTYAGTNDNETGNLGNHLLRIGRRGDATYALNGRIYGFIFRGASTASSDIFGGEDYMADKVGIPVISRVDSVFALGDSTVSDYLSESAVLSFITSLWTKVTVAQPGNTIDQQSAAWTNTNNRHLAKWVVIQVGLNDLNPASETTSAKITKLQGLVNSVKAVVPASCKVFISKMTPCRSRLITLYGGVNGPIAYQRWLDMNEAISGAGATPITNVDGRITAHESLMNDGSGNLSATYDTGDGIHPNNAGRELVADEWVVALVAAGVSV